VVILSSTIAGNIADFDSNDVGNGGGLRLEGSGVIAIGNSVLADNVDRHTFPAPDCAKTGEAAFVTLYNHVETTAGGCVFTGTGDVIGTDAGISPLGFYGGTMLTHVPLAGSPLIDAGDPAGCRDAMGLPLAADQRLAVRHFDGDGDGSRVCDKGSVEFGAEDVIFRDGFDAAG
jgi:hypothetical protein